MDQQQQKQQPQQQQQAPPAGYPMPQPVGMTPVNAAVTMPAQAFYQVANPGMNVAYPPQYGMQNGQQVMYMTGANGQPTPVVFVNQNQTTVPVPPQGNSCICCRASGPGTSMKNMRILQLTFAIIHLVASAVMLGMSGSSPILCWSYSYCLTWVNDIWMIFIPIATIGLTSAQICGSNPVEPSCGGGTPSSGCRYASDLVFAIFYTFQMVAMATVSWWFVPVWYNTVIVFILALVIANFACFALFVMYWVTYGNIRGCCIGQVSNF